MDLGLNGRTALVMGAGRGLGRAVAEALAGEGARVAVVSRSEEAIHRAAAEIGSSALGFVADATDPDSIDSLIEEVRAELGSPEILVLNAGGPPLGGVLEHDSAEWQTAYQSLVLTPRALVEAFVPSMRERNWGRIVNIGSITSREPIGALALSNTHRAGAAAYLKTLATEVAMDGVTVNTVATGRFGTDRLLEGYGSLRKAEAAAAKEVPARRLGRPEEFGDLVCFLCSERAGYLTGTVIPIDGGALRSF